MFKDNAARAVAMAPSNVALETFAVGRRMAGNGIRVWQETQSRPGRSLEWPCELGVEGVDV